MLYVGDDWAEDHHDVEIQDQTGRRLCKARLPEGLAGVARLHELIAEQVGSEPGPEQVLIGIETDRGPWVQALVAAGYRVYPINPRQVARYRERHANAGAKSDARDAHTLADMVRTDGHQLRPMAGDSPAAAAVKVLARAHQTLVAERVRHQLRLRSVLREYFPAALAAFDDLAAADVVELLGKAPDPESAARLTRGQITAALRRARRRDVEAKAAAIAEALRAPQLAQPAPVVAAFAALTRSLVAVIAAISVQIDRLAAQLNAAFDAHPDAAIYRSQPGLAAVLGPRVLGEFGDDPGRYADARARRNYAGTSPITRQSGKKKTVHARFVHNDRLIDALGRQAQGALSGSPGARAYYDRQRARGLGHQAALRQLANRLVGILHGCMRTRTLYDEATAWVRTAQPHRGIGTTGVVVRRGRARPHLALPPSRPLSPSTRSGSTWSARRRQPRTNDVDPRRARATMAAKEEGHTGPVAQVITRPVSEVGRAGSLNEPSMRRQPAPRKAWLRAHPARRRPE